MPELAKVYATVQVNSLSCHVGPNLECVLYSLLPIVLLSSHNFSSQSMLWSSSWTWTPTPLLWPYLLGGERRKEGGRREEGDNGEERKEAGEGRKEGAYLCRLFCLYQLLEHKCAMHCYLTKV